MSDKQETDKQLTIIASPCISNCCLDDEDICLGCFRHIDEIIGWHGADRERRLEILQNTEQRKAKSNDRWMY